MTASPMSDAACATAAAANSAERKPRLDLQAHLHDLEEQGLLLRVDRPINKDTELHPLVRWQFLGGMAADERRAFLFTNVVDSKGRNYDMPVVVGALSASPRIYALGMGRTPDEIGTAWLNAIQHPIAPRRVSDAPCQEVVLKGEQLKQKGGGLAALPVPVSTPGFDAAPYLTATLCITRDPQTGIQNMGTYRAALKATDRLAVRMVARPGGAGGYLHWLKYRQMKKPMQIAIVVGAAPVVEFTGPQKLAIDLDELAVAGGLAGQPIPIVSCTSVELDVPAHSEIVIEGVIDPSVLEPEAPFGESNGYVALEAFNMPMRVTAITHRRHAVFTSILSQVTPSESSTIKLVAYEPIYLAHLRDQLGIKAVKRVVMHEALTNLRPVVFVQIANGTARTEVWRALYGTANFTAGVGKVCIAVSEDIDPTNTDAILWSIAYRSNPMDDVHITPWRGGVQGSHYTAQKADSTLLVDATLKHDMPPLALPAREYMEGARRIWQELGLPALTVRVPWHGYTLGHWTESWASFARRAVAGDWEMNGEETARRQRGNVEPETPVWLVEGGKPKEPGQTP